LTPINPPSYRRTTLLALAAIALIGLLTLRPAPEAAAQAARTPWTCLVCGEAGTVDVFQNLLLFLPLGLAARWLGWGWSRSVGLALLGSIGIELAQATLVVGRDAALGDVAANALGGLLGWGLGGPMWGMVRRPHGRTATAASLALLGVMTALFALTAWLLSPMPPQGRATRTLTGPAIGPAGWSTPIAEAVLGEAGDTVRLAVVTRWGGASGTPRTPIARMEGEDGTLWGAVDHRAGTLGTEVRLWASVMRLRTPIVAVPVPALRPGEPLTIEARWWSNQVRLRAAGPEVATAVSGGFGPQHGWTLFTPFTARYDFAGSWQRWTLAWLVGWGVLLGWFAGGSRPRWWLGGAALAVLIATSGRAGVPVRPLEAAVFVAAWLTASAAAASAGSAASARRSPGGA
jgi:hypothetical protein